MRMPPVLTAAAAAALAAASTTVHTVSGSTHLTAPANSEVYWISNPTHVNETLLIAGGGLDKTQVRLCRDAQCAVPLDPSPAAQTWDHSIQLVLPTACTPPCLVEITNEGGAKTLANVNAPDIWFALAGSPAATLPTPDPTSRAAFSNAPRIATVTSGDVLRVFGRSLGWGPSSGARLGLQCLSTAVTPGPVATTTLTWGNSAATASTTAAAVAAGAGTISRHGTSVSAVWANCHEAAFSTAGVAPGVYPTVRVGTPWGLSDPMTVTVIAAATPPAVTLHVATDFGGNLGAAVAKASALVSTDPTTVVDVVLGAGTFKLSQPLALPNRTRVIGAGAGVSTVEVDLGDSPNPPPPGPPPSPSQCTTPVLADFYTKDCDNRGCKTKLCPGCFLSLGARAGARSPEGCCALCGNDPQCNAYTFIGSVDPPGGYCELRYCPDEPTPTHNSSCASTPSGPGPGNRTSGWVKGKIPKPPGPTPPVLTAGILVAGARAELHNFSVRVLSAPRLTPAIWATPNASAFVVSGLNVTLLQNPVSNALKIEAVGFEVVGNTLNQVGPCNAPNYGPGSDSTPFQPSVTIYLHNSRAGVMKRNVVYWRCSAYDLDVSDRVVFEENQFVCTEQGVVPHGNSISGYDWRTNPSSRWWSIARNELSRPPFHPGTEQNWIQRETMTTDGSGAYGSAHIQSVSGTTVKLAWLQWASPPVLGTTLAVLAGPGRGQTRSVVGIEANGTIVLDAPLDGWVALASAPQPSIVAVISSFGSKLIVGNKFNWTEVVQWYGNTVRGVAADNSFSNCNVKPGGNDGGGALGGVGECYHGSDPLFFTEFRGNSLENSDGISLRDSYNTGEFQCSKYGGPWVAWAVVRANAMDGISLAARNVSAGTGRSPNCARVTIVGTTGPTGTTSDIVAEQNQFGCPAGGNGTIQYSCYECTHSVRRP